MASSPESRVMVSPQTSSVIARLSIKYSYDSGILNSHSGCHVRQVLLEARVLSHSRRQLPIRIDWSSTRQPGKVGIHAKW